MEPAPAGAIPGPAADILVVGGGPAGASAAFHLAREGCAVRLLDRARFPRPKPCAEYLSPEASRLLAGMHVLEAVESAGAAQLAGMRVRAPNGRTIHGEFAARHGFRGFRDRGLALRRERLDAVLLDAARSAGAAVEEEMRVTDLLRDPGGRVVGVRCLDGDGRPTERRARLVVGADGLRSVVARRLALARSARWPRRLAFVAHYAGVAGIGAYGEMHVGRGGYLGLADVGRGETNVALVVPAARAREAAGDAASFVERWIAAHPHLAERFAGASRTDDVRATGPFASHARRAWAPGAALVGDAADFFDPFTGEGIYAALRGGEMLAAFAAEALAAADARGGDRALAAYDAARRREFGGKWRVERMIGAVVACRPLLDRAATVLERRRDMADLLVGVAGDFVPAAVVLRPSYLLALLFSSASRS
jgi:flavin-dependent dehydrogenase